MDRFAGLARRWGTLVIRGKCGNWGIDPTSPRVGQIGFVLEKRPIRLLLRAVKNRNMLLPKWLRLDTGPKQQMVIIDSHEYQLWNAIFRSNQPLFGSKSATRTHHGRTGSRLASLFCGVEVLTGRRRRLSCGEADYPVSQDKSMQTYRSPGADATKILMRKELAASSISHC